MHANDTDKRAAGPIDISPEQLAMIGGPKTVYIKQMAPGEIASLENLKAEGKIPAGLKLYAVHLMDGTRIAVVDDRDAAFAAARQHEMEPVSVH